MRKMTKKNARIRKPKADKQAPGDTDVARLIRRDGMKKTLEDIIAYTCLVERIGYIDNLIHDLQTALDNYDAPY